MTEAPQELPSSHDHWPTSNVLFCPSGCTEVRFCSEKCRSEASAYHSLLCTGGGGAASSSLEDLKALCNGSSLSDDMVNIRQFPLLASKLMATAIASSRARGATLEDAADEIWGG